MITYLRGKVIKKQKDRITLDVRDVGYEVYMSEGDILNLNKDEEVGINIFTEVKEGYIGLFGFLSEDSQSVFEKLKKVGGIGSKTAIQILSNMTPDEICISIANEDATILKQVPGIGAKTAARIILELKDKVLKEGVKVSTKIEKTSKTNVDANEAALALKVLGYTSQQIEDAMKTVDIEGLKVDEIIRKLLKCMR